MRIKQPLILVLTFLLIISGSSYAQLKQLVPLKTSVEPVLDGLLNDIAWENAMVADEFTSYWPVFGKPYPLETEVYMTYNEEDLFFAFKCYDPEPDKIISTMSARDQILNEDRVAIILDPFNDQQSIFAFYSNALGIQMDKKGTTSGEEDDTTADFVYYSAGKITEDGYVVEIRIPFKTLRYKRSDIVEMGIMFERRIQRFSISGTNPAMDPQKGINFFTQLRTMALTDIKHYTLVEVIPAFTYSRQHAHEGGELNLTKSLPDFSFTGKLGLSSQLVLDLTYNPDFSQVESDAGQIEENQRYSLFYPEKRPFFQEGSENFEIAAINEHGSFKGAVHTRQISNPLIGAKLSGKISPKTRLAVLYSMDEDENNIDSPDRFTNYFVTRFQHSLNEDSYLGLVTTSRVDPFGMQNHVAGSDGRIRLKNAASLEYHLLGSSTGDGEDKAQGIAAAVAYVQSNNDRDLRGEVQRIGEDFETQTGYLRRNGINRFSFTYSPHFNLMDRFISRISPMLFIVVRQDIPSSLWERELGLGVKLLGDRSLDLTSFINPSNEVYLGQTFNTNSVHLFAGIQASQMWSFNTMYRYGNLIRYVSEPYGGRGNTGSLTIGFQPVNQFKTSLSTNYSDFYKSSDGSKEFNYLIMRTTNTYQFNKYLFLRIIGEYNSYRKDLNTDFLISFTYIPGTVIHLGYGSLYEKKEWDGYEYQPGSELMEMRRGIFFKASYLFRK